MSGDLHSIRHEPALRGAPDPRAAREPLPRLEPPEDQAHQCWRDSVRHEPHLAGTSTAAAPPALHHPSHPIPTTLLGGLVGGLAAILFALVAYAVVPMESPAGICYVVVIGPVTEELLKAVGALWLLERRPWHLLHSAQFFLICGLSALVFATLENLLYVHVYVGPEDVGNFAGFVRFRWIVPTALHLCCSLIASLGLVRAWRLRAGRPIFDLEPAYPAFCAAFLLHGGYNLLATLLNQWFFPTPAGP